MRISFRGSTSPAKSTKINPPRKFLRVWYSHTAPPVNIGFASVCTIWGASGFSNWPTSVPNIHRWCDESTIIRNKQPHSINYADDILLYRAIKCEFDYSVLQDDINTINYWVEENHMQFNTAKCKYMLISHKRHKTTSPTALTIASHQIDKVESFKYLGLLFTSDLSWSKHITSVCNKAR